MAGVLETIERLIETFSGNIENKKQIDQLVYQLYGLMEDEIRIVEGE
jgi:hypothetical protein